ncbi:MAG: chromate transporter [Gammaproteobacteria bacterium]|nr:chromate transporter [Gammaproteobacteria bacterium]MBU0786471.1 chromate transporter [Gammaproteobacteria bacterium]MBU0816174.1 chromate transporter [Gammaproteobacteria bacterium]MBU1787800.1 chromate transporter [Gammaproteobacteria bacterium]
MTLVLNLSLADWIALFMHFASLSLLAVGGAITTTPDMHRFLVSEHNWMTESQFTSSIALAQSSPGPNVLFVALMGWNVGLNAGGYGFALMGVFITMLGIMLPSSMLTYFAARWGHQNREMRAVRAFKQGMAPSVVALLIATGWVLTAAHDKPATDWPLWLLTAATVVIVTRTKLHLLWLLGAGALLGALGLV